MNDNKQHKRHSNHAWDRFLEEVCPCDESISDEEISADLAHYGIDMMAANRKLHEMLAEQRALTQAGWSEGGQDFPLEEMEGLRLSEPTDELANGNAKATRAWSLLKSQQACARDAFDGLAITFTTSHDLGWWKRQAIQLLDDDGVKCQAVCLDVLAEIARVEIEFGRLKEAASTLTTASLHATTTDQHSRLRLIEARRLRERGEFSDSEAILLAMRDAAQLTPAQRGLIAVELAWLLNKCKEFDLAKHELRPSVEEGLNEEDTEEARVLASLLHQKSIFTLRDGEIDQAFVLARRALDIRRRFNGVGRLDQARTLVLLSRLFQTLGALDDACCCLTEARQIRDAILRPTHGDVLDVSLLLADVKQRLGRQDEALDILASVRRTLPQAFETPMEALSLALCHARLAIALIDRDLAEAHVVAKKWLPVFDMFVTQLDEIDVSLRPQMQFLAAMPDSDFTAS
ncbi:MAG: tetratricopeptide repeat protein [Planctomycetales bacterium]|nr:tetratricopeptide repeat protein [Planctomycetales bacterium]MCA9212424.1 tetratricopeptide repeat protein [Planctomycetales bacterium]